MLRKLNVDDLPQTRFQVKVVYRNPSGQVRESSFNMTRREDEDIETRRLKF